MVNEDLAEKCRRWVEEYYGVNQTKHSNSSIVPFDEHNRTNERGLTVSSYKHNMDNRNTQRRKSHILRNFVLTSLFAISIFIAYYGWRYDRSYSAIPPPNPQIQKPSKEHQTISIMVARESPQIDYVRLRQEKIEYFNREYQAVINLVRQGRFEEADGLSLKLKGEIQEAKAQGFY